MPTEQKDITNLKLKQVVLLVNDLLNKQKGILERCVPLKVR
jgi:hypothetical protein